VAERRGGGEEEGGREKVKGEKKLKLITGAIYEVGPSRGFEYACIYININTLRVCLVNTRCCLASQHSTAAAQGADDARGGSSGRCGTHLSSY